MEINEKRPYVPYQPEIPLNFDGYIEMEPCDPYKKDIALFYQFKTTDRSLKSICLIPDGCFDILFCCNPKKPSVILWTSPFQRKKQPDFVPDCEYFGVRFMPEQRIVKLNQPMKNLLDKQIPLHKVWSSNDRLAKEVIATSDFEMRVQTFIKYIQVNESNEWTYDQKIIESSIKEIYDSFGRISIRDLASKLGYTDRYLRKKFEEYVGFSPKQFTQIIRLQNVINTMLNSSEENFFKSTEEIGYYDQTHLNKDFKRHMKLTPRQFLNYLKN
jgi:AraC-like DNA-binding protein